MAKSKQPVPPKEAARAKLPSNTIAQGDCIELMRSWPKQSVDLVFADPPYNIGFTYDQYQDALPDEKYIAWTEDWISAATDLLKPTGSMYILIGDEYAAETRLHLKQLQRDGKLLFRNWIVWHYTFGQRCKVKYNRSHAHLFYCVGGAALNKKTGRPLSSLTKNPPFTFNYDAVAVPSARMTTYNDARQNPKGKLPDDTWYQKFPTSKDWYQRPQDAIDDAAQRIDVDADPDAPAGGYFDADCDTWYLSRLCGTFKEREQWHPCQLPEALLERIVLASSNAGDLVFDPFAGSGTTLSVANKLGRGWLGCEMSRDYRERALKRIKQPNARAGQPVVTRNGRKAGRQANIKPRT
ncbi:MAG: site-specific DNA-methyltransferase [Planctomycetota bacterium]